LPKTAGLYTKKAPPWLLLKHNRCSSKEKVGMNPTFFFAIKNSPDWTKLETNLIDLYEKIVDINCLKVFNLIEKFKIVA